MTKDMNFKNIFFAIELSIAWGIWMLLGILFGYIQGWRGGYNIWRCMHIQKIVEGIPYEQIASIAKNIGQAENLNYLLNKQDSKDVLSKEDILFYAFMMHPKIHIGIRAIISCFALCVVIVAGLDLSILYFFIAALFLFGIFKIIQGSMDII